MGFPVRNGAGGAAGPDKDSRRYLRRLPTAFERVIELPFAIDADVKIYNLHDSYRFVAPAAGLRVNLIRAHFIRIRPGMTKLLVGEQGVRDDMEMDRWRFKLPESTRPELATVFFENGELIVVVPKVTANRENPRVWNIGIDIRLLSI